MSAKRVLNRARSQIGVKESPPGSNRVKYTKEYGLIGPWCVMFLWWCFRHEGYGPDVFPTTASTGVKAPGLMQWAKKNGRWISGSKKPKVGDIVVFSFSHVGIVEKVHGVRNITTIEGNTDSSGSRTGGQVMRKRRTSAILGYFRPAYKSGSSSTPTKNNTGGILDMAHDTFKVVPMTVKANTEATLKLKKGDSTGYALVADKEFAASTGLQIAPGFTGTVQVRYIAVQPSNPPSETLKKGSTGSHVKKLQKLIGTTADGEFGPKTEAALKAYEKAHGMKVNGVVGKDQWVKLFPPKVSKPFYITECPATSGNTFLVASQIGKVDGHLRVTVKADADLEIVGGRVDVLH